MPKFKQYQLEEVTTRNESAPSSFSQTGIPTGSQVNPTGQDFVSSPNVLATSKSIIVGGNRVSISPDTGIVLRSTNSSGPSLLIEQADPLNESPLALEIKMEYGGVGVNFEVTNDPQSTAFGPALSMIYSASQSTTPVIGAIDFYSNNSIGQSQKFAAIQAVVSDYTSGSEDGYVKIKAEKGGLGALGNPISALDIYNGKILIYDGISTTATIDATSLNAQNRDYTLPDYSGTFNVIAYQANGTSAASSTIDWGQAKSQQIGITQTTTLTFSNMLAGGSYALEVQQDETGSRAITWPSTVVWSGGSAPTASGSGKVDLYVFHNNGSSSYGSVLQNY